MSFIGSMFSGSKGAGATAQGVSAGDVNAATNVANGAVTQQQNLNNQLAGQNGIGNQTAQYNQAQNLATGQGPNLAAAQLNQATNQAAQQQAGAMASAKGINPALAARQAATQGASMQQQAAGQAATTAAQQQLAGMQQAQGLANQQVNQQMAGTQNLNQAAQNEQANQISSLNNQNTSNTTIAAGNQSNQAGGLGGILGGAATALSGGLFASGGRIGYADGGPISSDAAPAPVSGPQSKAGQYLKVAGSGQAPSSQMSGAYRGGNAIGQAIGTGLKSVFGSKPATTPGGAEMPSESDVHASQYGAPGTTNENGLPTAQSTYDMYQSMPNAPAPDNAAIANRMANPQPDTNMGSTGPAPQPPASLARGGKVPVMVSPGEKYLTPHQAQAAKAGKVNPLTAGKTIPGKAKVKGDSYSNDIIPAKLEKGGLVIPRSVLQSEAPMREAIKFVHAHMAKGGMVGGMKSKRKAKSK